MNWFCGQIFNQQNKKFFERAESNLLTWKFLLKHLLEGKLKHPKAAFSE